MKNFWQSLRDSAVKKHFSANAPGEVWDLLTLAHDIWESVAAEGRSRLTESQIRELERRLDDDDRFPDDVIPWEQVKAEGRTQIGQ